MATRRWSVRLAVDAGDSGPISRALHEGLTSDVRRLSVSGPAGAYDEGADVVTFELDAPDARNARILAQHLLGEVRTAAGLPAEAAPVVWVAPLLPTEGSSHRFLDYARALIENGDGYDLAVVTAQIHLEVQAKILVEGTVASDSSKLTDALVDQRHSWAPHERWARAILEALFGVRMTDYPRWKEYQAHLTRRNDVAHRGQEVDLAAAQESIEVVEDFWLWLNRLAAKAPR